MTTTVPIAEAPVIFEAPQLAPAGGALYGATTWTDVPGPSRFLLAGTEIRPHNYGGDNAVGIWNAGWCVDPETLTEDDLKTGERPGWLDTFAPVTIWSYDECDLTAPSQAEVRARAAHNLELHEPVAVEREFAERLLADAPAPTETPTLARAVGHLEQEFAATNTFGVIHARAGLLAIAESQRLILRDPKAPGVLRTPYGHRWIFGGGYATPLGDTLIATSAPYGWRGEVAQRDTIDHQHNRFFTIAERSLLIGYEAAVGAAEIVETP